MKKTIDAGEIRLGELFTKSYAFSIPEYQRPYAWGTGEALQLLDDLSDALERNSEEPYFLGSVVLVKDKEGPHAEVIDGQQRLTTLTIIFSVLRDLAAKSDLGREIHGLIEEPEASWDNRPASPRLQLRPRDASFFRTYVHSQGSIISLVGLDDNTTANDAQRAIRDNARALHGRLSQWSDEQRTKLYKLMAGRTYLVVVSTPDINSAYRIFSVMNSRGLPLAPQDIFKSNIIGAIEDAERESYADRWDDLEDDLGRDAFGSIFLHIRTIASKKRAERNLLEEFPEQVLNAYLPTRPKAFIDDTLEPYARAYERIIEVDYEGGGPWDDVNSWLKRLSQLNNDDWQPPVLWALRKHGDEPNLIAAFLRKLERLAASSLLRREYTTPRQLRYLSLLAELDEGYGLEAPSFNMTDEEKQDTRAFLDGAIYLEIPERRKYVLLRLDSLIAADPGATYSHKIITAEHVLPQTPREGSLWLTNFTEEEREHWTHRLGNLLLLNRTKNSQAQNYDFHVKKEKYFTSKKGSAVFALTTQVLKYDEWTPDIVQKRHADLIRLLVDEWELA